MIRYKYDYPNATIKAVECARAGYPHRDADGDAQYDNTHFDNSAEAWEKLILEIEAGVSLDSREREFLREKLRIATERLADEAERLVRAKKNREAWKAEP